MFFTFLSNSHLLSSSPCSQLITWTHNLFKIQKLLISEELTPLLTTKSILLSGSMIHRLFLSCYNNGNVLSPRKSQSLHWCSKSHPLLPCQRLQFFIFFSSSINNSFFMNVLIPSLLICSRIFDIEKKKILSLLDFLPNSYCTIYFLSSSNFSKICLNVRSLFLTSQSSLNPF